MPSSTQLVIKASEITKSFQDTPVLKGVDLEVCDGESLALIGSNGSGKSTLLRCLVRLIERDTGHIEILGKNVYALKLSELRSLRAEIGFVFQKHNLVPRLSVLSNVIHGAQYRLWGPSGWVQMLAPSSERAFALECLELVGLRHLALRRADRLSGGQSQRVALARALMQRPRIILADEPVASLDPVAGLEVMELLHSLVKKKGITLLFTSHHLEHALQYSDRIIGLRQGQIELDLPPDQKHLHELKEFYDSAGPTTANSGIAASI